MRKKWLAGILGAFGLFVMLGAAEHYVGMQGSPGGEGALAHSLSAGVSAAATAPVNTACAIRGNPNIGCTVEFSGSAGDYCEMYCLVWYLPNGTTTYELVGVQTVIAVAKTITGTAADSVADVVVFNSLGGSHYEIRNGTPSAGIIRYRAWGYGVDTK